MTESTRDAPGRAEPNGPHDDQTGAEQRDTELRRILKDAQSSAFRKYQSLTTGSRSLWALLRYELLTGLLGAMPGALGILLRQKCYRWLLGRCGRGVVIGRNVTLRHPQRIRLGDNVIVDDHAVLDAKGDRPVTIDLGAGSIVGRNCVLSCKGGTIRLDEGVNLSVNCTLISETRLTVGRRVLIAGHCYIIAGGNHGLDRVDIPITAQPLHHKGGVRIERDSWLGAQATLLDGVTIGHDAVVAAGAVVQKPVEAYHIVGGVPAKVLRSRLEEDRQRCEA